MDAGLHMVVVLPGLRSDILSTAT